VLWGGGGVGGGEDEGKGGLKNVKLEAGRFLDVWSVPF